MSSFWGNNGAPGAPPDVANNSSWWTNIQNGIRLPTAEADAMADNAGVDTNVTEPEWFKLSWWDRMIVFGVCLAGAVVCFTICFLIMPVLVLKPRKFAVLWSLGSVLFVISFGVLQGPVSYVKHLSSKERLPFSIAFFGSIFATLYFSLGMKNTLLTIIGCIVQLVAAIWYTVSYFPFGHQSMRFVSRVGARQVTGWINS